MIPTDLHRSGSSLHFAGRRQGDMDERCSVAVGKDGTGLDFHRSVVWVDVARGKVIFGRVISLYS